jgi:fluoroacetyl-CoA thioesterase
MSDSGIAPGLSGERTIEVTPDLTASHLGSGSLRVYATPAMVALIEKTCMDLVADHLPDGETTVGVEIRVRHLAPTPVGGSVRAHAEVESVDGKRIQFKAQVWDDAELVGEAEHTRVIVEVSGFLQRVQTKIP